LGLQPGLELQDVLGVAQPAIRAPQRQMFVVGDQPREQQAVERGERAARAQSWTLAGVDQLQRLHEELDLANPAFAVLEVEPRSRGEALVAPSRARARVDELALDAQVERAHVVADRRRRVAREHERRQYLHDLGAEREIACALVGLAPRLALPPSAESFVVALERVERARDRAFRAFGSQPQIDAKYHVVFGDLAERARDLRAQLREVLVQRQRAGRAVVGRVDVDHVDVRREIELRAAELAHADHAQRRVALDAVVVDVAGRPVARGQLAAAFGDRGVEARVGEVGELAADVRFEPFELAGAEPDQLVGAHAAQPSAQWMCGQHAGELGVEDFARFFTTQIGVGGDPRQAVRIAR
jgi:hypothetical protein